MKKPPLDFLHLDLDLDEARLKSFKYEVLEYDDDSYLWHVILELDEDRGTAFMMRGLAPSPEEAEFNAKEIIKMLDAFVGDIAINIKNLGFTEKGFLDE